VFGEVMEGIHITEMKKKKFFERRTWRLLYIKDKDIIYEEELTGMLGNNMHNILSREQNKKYENGIINADYLRSHINDFSKHFYVCGPDKMITDINAALDKLGAKADLVVFEK